MLVSSQQRPMSIILKKILKKEEREKKTKSLYKIITKATKDKRKYINNRKIYIKI